MYSFLGRNIKTEQESNFIFLMNTNEFLCVMIEYFSLLIGEFAVKLCLYIFLLIYAMKMIKGISGQT